MPIERLNGCNWIVCSSLAWHSSSSAFIVVSSAIKKTHSDDNRDDNPKLIRNIDRFMDEKPNIKWILLLTLCHQRRKYLFLFTESFAANAKIKRPTKQWFSFDRDQHRNYIKRLTMATFTTYQYLFIFLWPLCRYKRQVIQLNDLEDYGSEEGKKAIHVNTSSSDGEEWQYRRYGIWRKENYERKIGRKSVTHTHTNLGLIFITLLSAFLLPPFKISFYGRFVFSIERPFIKYMVLQSDISLRFWVR